MGPLRFLLALALAAAPCGAAAQSLRGSVEGGVEIFPETPLFADQADAPAQPSLELRLQAAASLAERIDFVFSARAETTPLAEDPGFADVGEGFIEYQHGRFAARAGVLDEPWGVLDANNPTNIFNQFDLVDDFDGDSRLGQPGATVSYLGDGFTLTLLAAPVARERRLAEGADRFRQTALPLRDAHFEGGHAGATLATRASVVRENLELTLTHFHGTSREPEFELDLGPSGPGLRPVYRRIDQLGAEGRYVLGEYVLRGEAIHRWGQAGRPFAGVGVGVERLFFGIFDGIKDLQLYAEAYYDDRPDSAPVTAFESDVSLGGRLFFNNAGSTEVEARATVDLRSGGTLIEGELRHRGPKDLVWGIALTAPVNAREDAALSTFRRDERVTLTITRFF